MELKRLISQCTYRIEPKPEGGFVAHAADPGAPSLEAATREELQRKIQSLVTVRLAAQFPGLKLPTISTETKSTFHLEHKPGGGYIIHSADPKVAPIEVATHDEIESPFAQMLVGLLGKHLAPQFSQVLDELGKADDVKVVVSEKTTLVSNSSQKSVDLVRELLPNSPLQRSGSSATLNTANTTPPKMIDAAFGSGTMANAPITPEAGGGLFLRFLLIAVIFAAVIYLFAYHR